MAEWIVEITDGLPHLKNMKPLVRCKDCEHSYEDLHGRVCAYGRCLNCDVDDDWFCADGERKDG